MCELCQELAGAGAAQCQDGERLSDLHKVHALTRRLASVMETIQNLPLKDASELDPLTRGLLFEVAGLLRSYRAPLWAALEAQKAPLPEPVVAYKPALHIQRTASCPPLSPGARAAGLRSLGGSQSRACDARVTPLARRSAGCLTRPPWPMPPGHTRSPCSCWRLRAPRPERVVPGPASAAPTERRRRHQCGRGRRCTAAVGSMPEGGAQQGARRAPLPSPPGGPGLPLSARSSRRL